jgi:hypothetical protein
VGYRLMAIAEVLSRGSARGSLPRALTIGWTRAQVPAA